MEKFEPDFEKIRREALGAIEFPNTPDGKITDSIFKGASFVVARMLSDYHKQLMAHLMSEHSKSR